MGIGVEGGNKKLLGSAEPSQLSISQELQTNAFRTYSVPSKCASTLQYLPLLSVKNPRPKQTENEEMDWMRIGSMTIGQF